MVLQADVAFAGMVLVGDVELVRRAVGPLVLLRPLIQVHVRHLLAVEFHVDQILVAGDDDVVPLSHRLHGVLLRRDEVVERAGIVQARAGGVIDGDFDAVEADIFPRTRRQGEGADEDAAVALRADLEIHL